MARFASPGSIRYGKVMDWEGSIETAEEYLEVRSFIEYSKILLNKYFLIGEGVVTEDIAIERRNGVIYVKVEMYDRLLEILLEGVKTGKGDSTKEAYVRRAASGNVMLLKRMLQSEGKKFFGLPVQVEFIGLDFKGMNALLLSRYISISLERGYSVFDILRIISTEYSHISRYTKDRKDKEGLVHRYSTRGSEDLGVYKAVNIGGVHLLGYRIDFTGRFTRKQRASKKSISKGKVPLGNYKGYLDYGISVAVMEYGACSIRVWKYFDKKNEKKNYRYRLV